jgi:hypothetical protein
MLFAALSAGTQTKDLPNYFNLCLILVNDRLFVIYGSELFSQSVNRKPTMFMKYSIFFNQLPLTTLIATRDSVG